jgi:hypothetical protein
MPFFDPIRIGSSGAVASDYTVDRSLRFNNDDSAYLNRQYAQEPTSQYKMTFSCWVKRCSSDSGVQAVIGVEDNWESPIGFSNDSFRAVAPNSSVTYITTAKYRDFSAWMHVMTVYDTQNSTGADRMICYINGERLTDFSTSGTVPQDTVSARALRSGYNTYIAKDGVGAYGDMYCAEVNVIDGQALTPSDFTETNSITGQLIPKEYTGSYGTNGFYLNFSDNSGTTATTLGKDSSGNSNNFTPNNFSVSAGEGNDSLQDTPTNNFCTINHLDTYRSGNTLAEGNLKLTRSGNNFGNARGTFAVNSGKWYYEWKCTGQHTQIGWVNTGFNINYNNGDVAVTSSNGNGVGMYWDSRTFMYGWQNSGGNDYFPSSGSFVTYTTGDIIMVAFDVDNFKFWFGKNGSWINVLGTADPSSGTDGITPVASKNDGTYASGMYFSPLISCFSGGNGHINFGQRPFSYTIPTGYKTLCSANLPDPTILLPNKHFAAFTYTGTGSSGDVVNITNSDVDFTPDWVWVKTRDVTNDHILSDSVRGGSKYLVSSETYVEQTNTQKIRAFIQNGFESGTDGDTNWSGGRPFVAWNWNAGDTDGKTYTVTVVDDSGNKYRFDGYGTSAVTLDLAEGGTYIFNYPSAHPLKFSTTSDGTHGGGSEYTTGVTHNSSTQVTIVVAASAPTLYYYCGSHSGMGGQVNTNSTLGSSNFDGSIQTVTKVNATAGFSIVTYTGDGGNPSTVGHGLGVAADVLIVKNRSYAANWGVFHHKNTSAPETEIIYLNSNGSTNDRTDFNDTMPTSTVFSVNAWDEVNNNNQNYVAYCFSEVAGYSKFGSYTGNGNSDGPFIPLSFRAAWVLVKGSDFAGNWNLFDDKRPGFNVTNDRLFPNSSGAESDGSPTDNQIDILSNGFKLRGSNVDTNSNGSTYIYLAFAESPFKNARAR